MTTESVGDGELALLSWAGLTIREAPEMNLQDRVAFAAVAVSNGPDDQALVDVMVRPGAGQVERDRAGWFAIEEIGRLAEIGELTAAGWQVVPATTEHAEFGCIFAIRTPTKLPVGGR